MSDFRKEWFIDAQYCSLGEDFQLAVQDMWRDNDMGNDKYMIKRSCSYYKYEYPDVYKYIIQELPNISDDEEVIIHWWW